VFRRPPVRSVCSEERPVKKLLMLAAAAIGAQYAMKRKKGQDSREVWKQATR
jgi:hypothetical protein